MAAPSLLLRTVRLVALPLGRLSERIGNRFYVGWAALLITVAVYAIAGGHTGGMKHQAYDLIMKSRFQVPPPDPDIVLLDIDEASLAAMAPEYGRWPWPRSVMAELVEGLARQQPRAIVFDITFSDADVYQPQADKYFRDVVAHTPTTFFPMIRLNPENDKLSELRLGQLPGVVPASQDAPVDATIAVVVPYFFDVLDDRRLGTNNLYVDEDGNTRSYHVYREAYAWRIYSLPANVVAANGGALPEREDVLLNWRGRPPAYHTVSFHPVYTSLLKQQAGRPANEFAGKIIIIGSTAPSLFDLKPTPVAQNHPGVEILATALDNLKNQDYLSELPRWVYIVVTIVGIVALAAAFVYNVDDRWVNLIFTLVQAGLLLITYLFLNYTTWFVDLTAPFTAGLVYFSVARTYGSALSLRRNGHPWFSTELDPGRECQVLLLSCHLLSTDKHESRRMRAELQRQAGLTRYGAAAARIFKPAPLLYNLYRDTLLFYWLVSPGETCDALRDLVQMLDRSLTALSRRGQPRLRLALHATRFTVDDAGAWREIGKAAFVESMILIERGSAATLTATRAFAEMYDSCSSSVPLPDILTKAGLRIGTV